MERGVWLVGVLVDVRKPVCYLDVICGFESWSSTGGIVRCVLIGVGQCRAKCEAVRRKQRIREAEAIRMVELDIVVTLGLLNLLAEKDRLAVLV